VLAQRGEFVRRETGLAALLAPAAAADSIALRLERAPHGLHDLLAATQKVGGFLAEFKDETGLLTLRCTSAVDYEQTTAAPGARQPTLKCARAHALVPPNPRPRL
jgi:hypothetical protein